MPGREEERKIEENNYNCGFGSIFISSQPIESKLDSLWWLKRLLKKRSWNLGLGQVRVNVNPKPKPNHPLWLLSEHIQIISLDPKRDLDRSP